MPRRLLLLAAALTIGATPLLTSAVFAVSGNNWQAGRIIDDSVFTDKNSMSAGQIQSFLNSKVGTGAYGTPGSCDTNGSKTSELGGGTRAQYGAAHGNPAPFTCLKDYYEVPKLTPSPGMPANNYGGKSIPAGAESAAQLIWDAAQRYSINPEVLLVTIQKESVGPLTTDDWPFLSQYQYALGAHCPDSGPNNSANCDSNYAGFSIQVSEAAALLRYYLDNMTQPWWPYKKIGNNSVLYNPSTSCGSSTVNIVTMATAALYTYTPYQPNQAALNNLYGTGDGCSSYGNRNFWRIFNDWFGNTVGPNYQSTIATSVLYADASLSSPLVSVSGKYILTPGQKVYAKVVALNSGRANWDANTRLGTASPYDRASIFSGTDWLASNRVASVPSAPVTPGTTTTFTFSMNAPQAAGGYQENFAVVDDGITWLPSIASFSIDVTQPNTQPLAPSTATLDSSTTNTTLTAGNTMLSPDGYLALNLNVNGVLTLRDDFSQVWLGAVAGPGSRLLMQTDGNLVLYRKDGSVAWASNTNGNGQSRLTLQDDGNMVIYNNSGATWASNTGLNISHFNYTQNILPGGSVMYPGQKAQTADRKYSLVMQADGNVVLYSPNRAIWASNTDGKGGAYLSMQADGNLVLYRADGRAIWASNTDGHSVPSLYAQADGNLVIYSAGAVWATGTNGKQ